MTSTATASPLRLRLHFKAARVGGVMIQKGYAMNEMENINSLITLIESILSDIENRENLDTIGERYSELKSHTEKEIKLLKRAQTSQFIEAIYLPALNEFLLSLTAPKGTKDHSKIYDPLLDGVGRLKWYSSHSD